MSSLCNRVLQSLVYSSFLAIEAYQGVSYAKIQRILETSAFFMKFHKKVFYPSYSSGTIKPIGLCRWYGRRLIAINMCGSSWFLLGAAFDYNSLLFPFKFWSSNKHSLNLQSKQKKYEEITYSYYTRVLSLSTSRRLCM